MKFDAKKAEHEYITTNTSYHKLAKKYEVSENAIGEMSRKNNWVQKRKDYQLKLGEKLVEKSIEKEVDKLEKCKTATDRAIEIVLDMVNDCEDGTPQDMRTCVAALKDLIGMQRDLHGLLTRKDELSLRQETGSDGETGVVYMPALTHESDVVVIEGDENG